MRARRARRDWTTPPNGSCLAVRPQPPPPETLGLRVRRESDGAWITAPAQHRAIDFVLQLGESGRATSRLRFYGEVGNVELLRSLGFAPDTLGWAGTDPDRRRVEFLPESTLPRR